jgi:hypothetical protein
MKEKATHPRAKDIDYGGQRNLTERQNFVFLKVLKSCFFVFFVLAKLMNSQFCQSVSLIPSLNKIRHTV